MPFPEKYSARWVMDEATDEEIRQLDAVTDILIQFSERQAQPIEELLLDPESKRYGDWALDIIRAVRGESGV